MAQDVDHSPQVPNKVPDQVPGQATIRGNPKKQTITKKSGLAGNHGKSEVWNFFKKVLEEETGK
ncbi:zinc finger BED domain-containing protein RICESLEEPER 2 [Prunus yedoensis var. nudiflora]|uniref:Zinc finger BED domain-containing protein RICESLEEPER 2 n=1 Tax=Prunus yedoensis var. nudiflora TaxID=2094558 RepID=A0A314UAN3_PRUYE|nr:zinc finger BED domain-containing protein RICESLEEPER 2 [Prunus yedoensis var. nudiflora]